MITPEPPAAVDLTNCDREPIHVIGHVQPYGAVLALDPGAAAILQASESTAGCLGVPAERLLGRGLEALFDDAQIEQLRRGLSAERLEQNPLHVLTAAVGGWGTFHVVAHRHEGLLILEIEPVAPADDRAPDFYVLLNQATRAFDGARTREALCEQVVQQVRRLSGFDRVMIYRFLPDGSGVVLAEDRADELEPYLGLHYPASDIPRQARALYLSNAVRIIADARYRPARLVPELSPLTGRSLDLTYAALRGVSSMHTEYLENMGVRASMSLALVRGSELWGLVACHHRAPRRLPYDARAACEVLARVASLQLPEREASDEAELRARSALACQAIGERMTADTPLVEALTAGEPDVRALVASSGAAVLGEGACRLFGRTPGEAQVRALAAWLAETQPGKLFATDALPEAYEPAGAFTEVASGLLSLPLPAAAGDWLLWFRPEVVHTVTWAGDPHKPVEAAPGGARLSPRRSFALWKETVRGRSQPWRAGEIDAAQRLGATLAELTLLRSREIAERNVALARSNSELDAFAYAASHDLKEPLRGIHNYASFLLEDYQDKLDTEGKRKLETVLRLTQRMRSLIDSLLHFSRVGKTPLCRERVDLDELVTAVLETLGVLVAETGAKVVVPRPLPAVEADRVRLQELLENLVSNAIKYSEGADRVVEIGFDDEHAPLRLYVKDEGIGIAERHWPVIFHVFKRLHPPDRFGGGTGVGLTIAKRIVESHGGRLWLDSTEGQGTTFWFTLEAAHDGGSAPKPPGRDGRAP
jgi:two-component system, chemotaxis family, sensor kinase Cph1